jgi:hypothetical protein
VGIYVPPVDLRNLRPAREGPRPGGDITWAATAAVGVTTVAMALVLGDGREFMAAAACIAFGVVFAIRPAYGVYAIVIARPSMDLWADRSLVNVGSVSVNPASALAMVFIAVGGAYIIENWSRAKQAPSAVPYIGLVTMAVLSVSVAPSKGGAITETLRLTSVAVLYLAAYTLIRDRQSLKRMTIALLASLIVPTVLALWQFDHGGSTVIGLVGRSAGTFVQPDPFGIFMGFMVAFMVPLVLCKQLKGRWILWLATPPVLVALVASYTRTGWVGCLFGLFVLALIRYRALLLIGPLVLVLVAAAVPSTVHRFGDLTSGRTHYGPGNSLRARLDLWRTNLPRVEHDRCWATASSRSWWTPQRSGRSASTCSRGPTPTATSCVPWWSWASPGSCSSAGSCSACGGRAAAATGAPARPATACSKPCPWDRCWRPPRTS